MRRLILVVAGITLLMIGIALALPPSASPVGPKPGDVLAGQDFGFRVTSTQGHHVVGVFVVRVNGQWTQAEEAPPVPRVVPARP
jgi:hypothetical protein